MQIGEEAGFRFEEGTPLDQSRIYTALLAKLFFPAAGADELLKFLRENKRDS